jgi:hypothetical protein
MLNPFFLQGSGGEQNLIQDLINEQLRMYGVEIYYLPRQYVTEKTVIKEVIESKFSSAYPIEAYVENYEGYSNNPTILSKFGIQSLNEINLTISRERYELYISPLIKDIPNIKLSTRPKEGDLIYFPLGDRLFEIKYVEHEKPFYQLQKNYVYTLSCELFRYEDENIDTSIEEIDDNIVDEGYIQTLTLVGTGITATAIASLANGVVSYVTMTNRGNKYSYAPTVAISSAPTGGLTAVGIATMIGGLIACDGSKNSLKVQGVQLINPGYGYTVAPSISFIGGDGSGATGITSISNGGVGIVTITSGGSGYTSAPTITFSDPPSPNVRAQGVVSVSNAGVVTAIYITNAGSGYTSTPTITISSPITNVGIGTFVVNETIAGQTSGTTAIVKSWNSITKELNVSISTGSFIPGEQLIGQKSGASYMIRKESDYNTVDPYASNEEIENEADYILDFTESNPFGNP